MVRLSFIQPLRRFAPAPLVGEPLAKRQSFPSCQGCFAPGLRFPASAHIRSHPADRCPNNFSLLPPLAAVEIVALARGGGCAKRRRRGLFRTCPFSPYCASSVPLRPYRHASGSPFGRAGAKRLRGQGHCQKSWREAQTERFSDSPSHCRSPRPDQAVQAQCRAYPACRRASHPQRSRQPSCRRPPAARCTGR